MRIYNESIVEQKFRLKLIGVNYKIVQHLTNDLMTLKYSLFDFSFFLILEEIGSIGYEKLKGMFT